MMVSFCNHLTWTGLSVLLGDYSKRLGFGVRAEVIPLLEIKGN
jgi:POLQ-like helicase